MDESLVNTSLDTHKDTYRLREVNSTFGNINIITFVWLYWAGSCTKKLLEMNSFKNILSNMYLDFRNVFKSVSRWKLL